MQSKRSKRVCLWSGLLLYVLAMNAAAHGGVMFEDDQCVIRFGFYKAHFTVYQPKNHQDQEFCEDLPGTGATVFVLGYLHASLARVPVDFRILRDATGLGRFAKWSDLEKIENLESHGVFYQKPALRPDGVLMVEVDFAEAGDYIGIVTAKHPTNDKTYRAVFPFRVANAWLRPFIFALIGVLIVTLAFRFRAIRGLIGRLRCGFSSRIPGS